MKYFKRGWFSNPKEIEGIINEYENYYKTIENQLSDNIKQIMKHRHDTHIVKTYVENKDYIMDLDEEIWGKAKFVFRNAEIKINGKIEDEWWLYDEVYKVGDKIEIHILFDKADIIIICDDAYIEVEEKEYLKNIYNKMNTKENDEIINKFIKSLEESNMSKKEKEHLKVLYLYDDIKPICPIPNKLYPSEIIENKKDICGYDLLNTEEKVIFHFVRMYTFIKYNNIENIVKSEYSMREQMETQEQIFKQFEEDMAKSLKELKKYKDIINNKEFDYIIKILLEICNKKDVPTKEKKQLYLNVKGKFKNIDFNKIYEKILKCINEDLIK